MTLSLRMVDESSWQQREWNAVRLESDGVKVAWIKCTEGPHYVNAEYAWQVQEARAAGCVVIHAHLSRYGDITTELDNFLTHKDLMPGELVGFDNEAQYLEAIPLLEGQTWIYRAASRLRATLGVPACVQYTSADPIAAGYFEGVRGRQGVPLFLAWPGADPKHPPAPARPWPVSMLQYSVTGNPATDLDAAYYGTESELRALGADGGHRRVVIPAGSTRTLAELAQLSGTTVHAIWTATVAARLAQHGALGGLEAEYLDSGQWNAPMPAGLVLWTP